jgi:hypothetical protein
MLETPAPDDTINTQVQNSSIGNANNNTTPKIEIIEEMDNPSPSDDTMSPSAV